MNWLYLTIWAFIAFTNAFAKPHQRLGEGQKIFRIKTTKSNQRTPSGRQAFKIQDDKKAPLWHNTTSRLYRRDPDAISLHVDANHMFAWTPIQLGVQPLGVMLDIGSTQFWVFAAQNYSVQPSGLLSYTQLYVPGASESWQSIPNATFASGYMAGFTATGIVGTDSLTVGQLPPVRQHVGVMWYDNPVVDPQQIQGILGLGLSSDRSSGTMGMPTFLDLLMPNMQAPMFTIALDKWDTGTWDFGHIDESKYVGSLQTVAVDDNCSSGGSWKVGNMFAQFPNQTIPQTCGFFDTGYDFINLDIKIVARYYQEIPGANMDSVPGQYTFPCDASMPDLNLIISGVNIRLRGQVLNYHPYDAQANICMGVLQNAGDGGGAVFGQFFMKAQFMVFNVGSRTISFAEIRPDL